MSRGGGTWHTLVASRAFSVHQLGIKSDGGAPEGRLHRPSRVLPPGVVIILASHARGSASTCAAAARVSGCTPSAVWPARVVDHWWCGRGVRSPTRGESPCRMSRLRSTTGWGGSKESTVRPLEKPQDLMGYVMLDQVYQKTPPMLSRWVWGACGRVGLRSEAVTPRRRWAGAAPSAAHPSPPWLPCGRVRRATWPASSA